MTTPLMLRCHASTPTDLVASIGVSVSRRDALSLRYRLSGTVARLRVPPLAEARWVEGLWRHTCFELFVGPEALPGYTEFNLAPSGDWAAFAFHSYRSGTPLRKDSLVPSIDIESGDDWLELSAEVPLEAISKVYGRAALRIGLSAVIEDELGKLSYWALAHPASKPDFHHPDSFALHLPALDL